MSLKTLFAASAIALAFSTAALAQESMDHSKMGHGAMQAAAPKGDTGPSSTAFAEANARMHAAMDIEYSGNADADFVRGMIAHHQGAIDMAKIELQYGKDEALRKLAEGIISAQEGEIKMMKEWLAKNGG
ncbi:MULTISPECIES: DUF305 domain-containing protein [unclassified Rhizobium]|uniref:CopM family metallochaperone n=1 Tax=unclassified Rhizobium TaxID=2613769 RepID=UPI0006FC8EE3|nr:MULTISPECIES: DUF305 domain-containing protein [unclassified Rhizobium]KQV43776.1 hypothetical protein ASC86_02940 [Rhizobium sp. Root1212]KRD37960.1 hypothetical protein ASE37_02940 [Rhizobium sp. Root268]